MHHTSKRRLAPAIRKMGRPLSAAKWLAGALVALFPLVSHALGFGKLTVRSALSEPLNAEIEITSVDEKELKGLQVGLAPSDAFDQAGVERLPFLTDIKFTVSKRADGNYFVQLRTEQQLEEPFLHLLMIAEWPGGRLVREYTALIDPPTQVAGKPAAIESPQATPSTVPVPAVTAPATVQEQPKAETLATDETKPVAPVIAPQPSSEQKAEQKPEQKPEQKEQQQTATAQPAEQKPAESASQPTQETSTEPKPEPAVTAAASPQQRVPSIVTGAEGYTVKRGDTAWRIAEGIRTNNNYTIEQIVLALYRANPHAFFGSNVNNLKTGPILKIPESSEIESVSSVQARTQFRAQYDAWQEYKIKLAGASSAIKVADTEPKQPAVKEPEKKEPAPKPVAKAPAPKETPKEAPKEVAKETTPPKEAEKTAKAPTEKAPQSDELLKIVRSTVQGDKTTPDKKPAEGEARKDGGAKERQALADRMASLEESAASRQMETKELGDKIAQVRAQLKREARLIQIDQKDLAAAQARAKPEASKPTETAKPAEPAPKPEAAAPKTETKPEPAPKAEAPKPVEKPAEAPKPETHAPRTRVTTAPKPPAPPTPAPAAEEKGFVSELMDSLFGGDMLMPILIGVVVLLSAGIAFVYMSRRRKSIAEFEESILQSEGTTGQRGEASATTDTSGQVVSTGDTSFLSDFSQGGMGNIHTDEVDPIAEAEVYLAYGRDETAEEILKEAVVKNPAREEVKLKLLEIYANRNDVRAFETMAEEMYAAMGGRPSKNWARVEELGRKLNPDNPMFKGGGAGGGAAPAGKPSFADTQKMKNTMVSMPPMTETRTAIQSPAAEPEKSDFDFDMGSTATAAAPAASDFSLDLGDTSAPKSGGEDGGLDFSSDMGLDSTGADAGGGSGGNVVDFDFGEKEEMATAGAPETELAVAEAPAGGADTSTGELGESPQWDETATKLDLARAYIDMGDSEGARSILQEVMAEGNEQQKSQAKELAAQIG